MNESSLMQSASDSSRVQDPAAVIAAIEAQATRHETPCGDGHMVWRRWGAGRPLILFHGGSGSWSHWIHNVGALARRHTVWAPDLPGFGESAAPAEPSVEAVSEAVERGLRTLIPGDELIDMVGFSFGSAIASMIASRMEGNLCNLVLLGGVFVLYSKRVNLHLVAWKNLEDPAERLAAHRRNLEIMMMADPGKVDALAVYLQDINTRRARVVARKWTPSPGDKLHEYFPRVRARGQVAVIYGREDKGGQELIASQGSALQADHPGVRFQIIEDAGHWVQYEAADQINELLLETLSECGQEM